MAAKTRLGSGGYGIRRTGSFSGKTAEAIVLPALSVDYVPGIVPFDNRELQRFLQTEFTEIYKAISVLANGFMPVTYVEPSKPRNGMVKLADGVQWDPGSGEGVYVYYNGAWNKL